MNARYCSAACQMNHWPKHKTACKLRAAELRNKALFKDPSAKEDCPICFIPMPTTLICCISLPLTTIKSVPIYDFAEANEELADEATEGYYPCCAKSICGGCIHSFGKTGNNEKCPFCNSDTDVNSDAENIGNIMKRVDSNDTGGMHLLGNCYYTGLLGLQQDHVNAIEQYTRAADLGLSKAHCHLGDVYCGGSDLKKAKFHFETAAMAGCMEYSSGNME